MHLISEYSALQELRMWYNPGMGKAIAIISKSAHEGRDLNIRKPEAGNRWVLNCYIRG